MEPPLERPEHQRLLAAPGAAGFKKSNWPVNNSQITIQFIECSDFSMQFLEMSAVQNIAKQSLGNLSINRLDVL